MSMKNNWRNTPAYRRWQTMVFKRDGFRCVICGSQEDLVADHIKSAYLYPNLRYVVSNGRTLCKRCHSKIGMRVDRVVRGKMYKLHGTIVELRGKYRYGVGCPAFELNIGEDDPYLILVHSGVYLPSLKVGDEVTVFGHMEGHTLRTSKEYRILK